MFNTYLCIGFLILDLILAGWAVRKYFSKLLNKRKNINRLYEELRKFNRADYSSKFEEIDKLLSDDKTAGGIWREFSRTLTKNRNVDDQTEIYSTIEAGAFFRYSHVVHDVNTSYWQNFGSIYTGVGILGTFLGLVIGLNGVDLTSNDVTKIKDSIGLLLNGISVAFGTSLLGIFFALIYGVADKKIQDCLSDSVDKLSNKIEDMYPRKTIEQWMSDGHHETVEQTKVLKNLGQDMAESLSELLDAQLTAGFEELCENLDRQMKPTFEKLYEAISALNDGGATAIAGAVSEKAGAQLDAFAETLQNMQESMKQSLEVSEKTSAQANVMLTETMRQIGESLKSGTDEAVQKQREAASEISEQMSQMVASFNASSEKAMNNMLQASTAAQQGLSESIETTKNSAEYMSEAMKTMTEKQQAMLNEAAESNNATAQHLLEVFETMSSKQKEMLEEMEKNSREKMEETILLLRKTISEHNDSIEQHYASIKEMAGTINNVLDKVNSSSDCMEKAAEPVLEASRELKNQLEKVQEQTRILHEETTSQLSKLIEQGHDTDVSLQKLSDTTDKAEQKAIEAWEKYNNGMSSIGQELSNVLDMITEKISNYNQLMNKGMNEQMNLFDKDVATVSSQLKTVIDELGEMVADLLKYNESRK